MQGDVTTCQEDWLHNGDEDECGSQLHEAVTQLCDALRQQVVHIICVLYQSPPHPVSKACVLMAAMHQDVSPERADTSSAIGVGRITWSHTKLRPCYEGCNTLDAFGLLAFLLCLDLPCILMC